MEHVDEKSHRPPKHHSDRRTSSWLAAAGAAGVLMMVLGGTGFSMLPRWVEWRPIVLRDFCCHNPSVEIRLRSSGNDSLDASVANPRITATNHDNLADLGPLRDELAPVISGDWQA